MRNGSVYLGGRGKVREVGMRVLWGRMRVEEGEENVVIIDDGFCF